MFTQLATSLGHIFKIEHGDIDRRDVVMKANGALPQIARANALEPVAAIEVDDRTHLLRA